MAYLHIRQNPRSPSRHHVGSQPAAIEKGIEFFVVSEEQQFRVVAELTVETET
jgi:hypothetical protein